MQISEIRSDVPLPVEKENSFPFVETLEKLKVGQSFQITGLTSCLPAANFSELAEHWANTNHIKVTSQYETNVLTIWRTE